jgi:hypothetical protein
MPNRILVTAVLFGAIIIGLAACLPERAVLIVEANTPVHDSVWSANTIQKEIAVLRAGTKTPVYRCIDIKHYFVYEIRLADGRKGYVDSGSGVPEVRSAFLPPYSHPVVWNCP